MKIESDSLMESLATKDSNANEWMREDRTQAQLPHINLENASTDSRKLLGIDGYWYDLTSFVSYHPGGAIIEKFLYKDATSVFKSMHYKEVLGKRQPVARYNRRLDDPATETFANLHHHFLQKGYFETDLKWYSMKIGITLFLGCISTMVLVLADSFLMRIVGGILLAGFWQQCAFHMHDFMHNQVFKDKVLDQRCGTLFGTAFLGISASWWRDEHFVHHALTNTVDYETMFVDPQMHEPSWAQNTALFPFHSGRMEKFLISIQHFTFVPVCIFFGRPYIIVDSLLKERQWHEWSAFLFHCLWTYLIFRHFPSYLDIFLVYFLASSLQGILHVQLLLNHYARDFFELSQVSQDKEWYRVQIESNLNILNPEWLDWFHGGLNLHICHHLYPTMPRHNYRKASAYIRQECHKLGIDHYELCLTDALVYTLKHLKKCGKLYSLDPR